MIKISFIGDVMCESAQLKAYGNDFNDIFSGLIEFFSNSDYVVANLETPIAGVDFEPPKKYSFNAPVEFAAALQEAGVNLVSTANNHCLDRGIDGLYNTIAALDGIGLAHIGTSATNTANNTLIKELKGLKIGFLAHTYGTNAFDNHYYLSKKERHRVSLLQRQENGGFIDRFFYKNPKSFLSKIYRRIIYPLLNPYNYRLPIYERVSPSFLYKKQIRNEINKLKKGGADYIIALTHIGGQYNAEPTKYTRKTVKWLIKHGVNAVVCNHEHVVHRCDWSRITEGIFAAYCLGNFTSISGVFKEPYDKKSEYSVVLNLYLLENKFPVRLEKVTISVVKSIPSENGGVKPVLLHDLISNCKNYSEKQKLVNDNLAIVNTFLDCHFDAVPLLREYVIPYLAE